MRTESGLALSDGILPKSIGMMVARDGVEPSTPAFSGLDTAARISLIPLGISMSSITLSTSFLGQHWDRV